MGREICHWLLPRTLERSVVRHDIHYALHCKEDVDRKIFKYGVWERKQIDYFFTQCQKLECEIFMDIGAYFGYYSLLAAKLGVFSQIHAVEASPVTYPRLEKHIFLNQLENTIMPYLAAASDTTGEVFLKSNWGRTKILESGTLKTHAQTLDSMFDFQGKNIAIKMDIESHEIPALKGAKKLIEKNNVFLQVEAYPKDTATINYLFNSGWQLLHYIECDFYFYRPKTSTE